MACLRRTFPSTLVCMLAVAFALSLGLVHQTTSAASCSSSSHPSSIKYYVHALDNSSAKIVSDVNPSVSSFGRTVTFNYPLTKKQNISSTSVGSIRGVETADSFDQTFVTIIVLNTVTYDDGKYSGTVSLHGQANVNQTSYEISIVGGTGDFRGARGYVKVTNLRTPGNDHIFKQALHFESC